MKKILLASVALLAFGAASAMAADLPVKAPVYKAPPPPAINWTGFYLGGHLGGGWSDKDVFDRENAGREIASGNISGLLGGVQAGYNYQVNPWLVLGIEGDFSWADVHGNLGVTPAYQPATMTARADWMATLTGRIGTTWDRSLLYVKGGAAWVHDKYQVNIPCPTGPNVPTEMVEAPECEGPFNGSSTNLGWTVGAGWEYAFNRNWSVKLEYDYLDFGTQATTFTDPDGDTGIADIRQHIHAVKAGFNYKFDWLH